MFFYYFDRYYWILIVPALLFAIWAQSRVSTTYRKYSQVRSARGMTAAQVCRQILDENGLFQIRVEHIAGNLTDHYDPRANVIRLSDTVYNGADQRFEPEVIDKDGKYYILDWSHATQGNASADAATTYLLLTLQDPKMAEMYMNMFCDMSDTAKQYVQRWLPIVAASRLTKAIPEEKDLLEKWLDVVEYE